MKTYTLLVAALLLSGGAFAQTQSVAGGGCTSGTHTFCVLTTADSGTGSLRQAIIDSNTAGGANTIGFAIPTNPLSPTPQTITLASSLPMINLNNPGGTVTSLIVDGYSQPGSVLNTNTPDQGGLNTKLMIEIVGAGNSGNGFGYGCCANPFITVTLQGLNLHSFGYTVAGQSGTLTPEAQWNIYGCFIGTTIDGAASAAVKGTGLLIGYDNAQIGGAQAWQRNLISGHSSAGVTAGTGASNATVIIEGNLIGTDVSGALAVPNNPSGLNLTGNSPGLRVGCTGAGCTASGHPSRNVISGNYAHGIAIDENAGPGGAQIKGNVIGADWTGIQPLPNGNNVYNGGCPMYCNGIQTGGYDTAPALIIGGFAAGEANVIAYNYGPGISGYDNGGYPSGGASFDSRGNAIHNNAGTDIAFTEYGWIPNDPGDADPLPAPYSVPNNKQNYPVIQSASVSGTPGNLTLNVTYLVDSATMYSTYPLRIDFYVDVDEGSGEYLVSDSYIAANAQMTQTAHLPLPASVQTLAGFVATATDANGYSSEIAPSYVFDRIFADRFEGH